MSATHTFSAGFLFCGLGAGARGFLDASARLGGHGARFHSVGGIDIDPGACADFEALTGSPSTCADVATMTADELRAAWGDTAPNAVFASPPCKGYSGLLPVRAAATPKYQALNRLALQGVHLVTSAWGTPPGLIVLENVPRIQSRGAILLEQVRNILRAAGYLLHEASHDCGEIGGLAQHRRRYLLVARQPEAVPAFVYRPRIRRVRACGEVLGALPLPENPAAGSLHTLPRLSWLNWARLALIPAGGDWRDLPRGELPANDQRHEAKYRVSPWADPAPAVTGARPVTSGGPSVADPRLALGQTAAGAGAFKGRPGLLGVARWERPAATVAGTMRAAAGSCAASVADPRLALGCSPRAGSYGVLGWDEPASTVTGSERVDNGTAAVADPRLPPGYLRLSLDEALQHIDDGRPPAGVVPVIASPHDGTWHRPLTTLELAALQGMPAQLRGAPLTLAGRSVAGWRERIGNAVPVGAGQAIGESLLLALLSASLGTWTLGSTGIWVRRREVIASSARPTGARGGAA
jgi:site-specific DNA-cytosine methylase